LIVSSSKVGISRKQIKGKHSINWQNTELPAGSYLVKAAIGESIDNETLGGATTHCEINYLKMNLKT